MGLGRRLFLKTGVAAGMGLASGFADELAPEVAAEMARRKRFMSPPDGTPMFGSIKSPMIQAFQDPLFIPPVAQPLFEVPDDEVAQFVVDEHQRTMGEQISPPTYQEITNEQRWGLFQKKFHEIAEKYSRDGIDIGGLPIPDAHQRFFDFFPRKFYIIREKEFPWQFHSDYGKYSWSWGFETEVFPPAEEEDGKEHFVWNRAACQERVERLDGVPRRFVLSSPGPTFHARYGEPILVRRINDLPEIINDDDESQRLYEMAREKFKTDYAQQHGAGWQATWHSVWEQRHGHDFPRRNIKFALPSTTTHLHNAHTASESDGHPNDWINPGEYWDHHYGNFPSGYDDEEKLSTLWYHDHRMDFTASNVYAGLDGFYFLFDETHDQLGEELPADQLQDVGDETKGWQLPSGQFGGDSKYDIPLIFHDLLFEEDEDGHKQLVFDGFNTDGILGDCFTVNRIIQPHLEVEPRKYRFRLLNGGPSRFYDLYLHKKGQTELLPITIICGDGNFQPNPLLAWSVYLGVAQRVDIIVDFSAFEDGDQLYLVNQLEQSDGKGPSGRQHLKEHYADETDYLRRWGTVEFRVKAPQRYQQTSQAERDPSCIPLLFRSLPRVDLTEVRRERLWEFDYDGGLWTINGMTYDPNRVDAGIEQNTAEIWTFRNVGNSWSHPIHSHFTEFIVLEINGVPQYQYSVQEGDVARDQQLYRPQRMFLEPRDYQLSPERRKTLDDAYGANKEAFRARAKAGDADAAAEAVKEIEQPDQETMRLATEAAGISEAIDKLLNEIDDAAAADQLLPQLLRDQLESLRLADICISSQAMFEFVVRILAAANIAQLDLREQNGRVQGNGRFMGGPRRDVALLLPTWEVKVFMRWKDFLGKHVMHCHNVVHEDHAMMIRWDIVPPGHGFDTPQDVERVYGIHATRIPRVRPSPEHTNAEENMSDPERR